jgi:hypothetical protein
MFLTPRVSKEMSHVKICCCTSTKAILKHISTTKNNEEEKKSRPPFRPLARVCRPAALPSAHAGLPPTRGSHNSHVYSLGSLEFHPSHVHTIET